MNLFCFSLEGSLDSLYEAVQESSGSSSPVLLSEPWRTSGRSVSVDMSQIYREKQRTSTPKSVSETGGLADHSICAHSSRHVAIKQEALVPRNNQNEDAVTKSKTVEQRQIETRNTQARCSGASTLDHSHRRTGTTVKAATTQRRPANEKQDLSFHRQNLKQQPVGHINSAKGTTAEAAVGSAQRSKISERPAHSRSRWSSPPERAPHRVPGRASPAEQLRSTTSLDFCASDRSTSFGRVDALRHQPSPSRLDESEKTEAERESISENEKLGSLGKKMKTISLTMRKRIGKRHVLSEDVANDTVRETEAGFAVEKKQQQSSNSSESLYSGQSSSSGVLSSDASSYKDELSTLQFCGQARAHTDFVPSPYDTDSLKLKVGDIINIISKPPMGIWTGMLENKVGNFKFIYVEVLPEKELEEEETPKIRTMKVCKKPRPNTLLELLERLHLEEYASSLLLNGYQTVDDLKHLKERHLIELNVTDPEDRRRLLAASDCLYVSGKEDNTLMKVDEEEGCPRDSGCFIPAECTDC